MKKSFGIAMGASVLVIIILSLIIIFNRPDAQIDTILKIPIVEKNAITSNSYNILGYQDKKISSGDSLIFNMTGFSDCSQSFEAQFVEVKDNYINFTVLSFVSVDGKKSQKRYLEYKDVFDGTCISGLPSCVDIGVNMCFRFEKNKNVQEIYYNVTTYGTMPYPDQFK